MELLNTLEAFVYKQCLQLLYLIFIKSYFVIYLYSIVAVRGIVK
jgi:hypothetical protein